MSTPLFEESCHARRAARTERRVFDVTAARKMLPLARRIAQDLVAKTAELSHLELELHRKRHSSAPREDLAARFRLEEEVIATAKQVLELHAELRDLGVIALDAVHGILGFPSLVNGSLAFLVYRLEENDLLHWRYRDQPKLRAIPEGWIAEADAIELREGHTVPV